MYTHFYFVDIFPTEHVLFEKRILISCTTTSCITYKLSRCDLENPSNDAKGEDE
jgi:hypothetical protein